MHTGMKEGPAPNHIREGPTPKDPAPTF